MPRASSAPRHRHSPHDATARPSWTPAHIDHRLNSHKPSCTRPTLICKGRSDPKTGEDDSSGRFQNTIPNDPETDRWIPQQTSSCFAPRANPPREGHRGLLPLPLIIFLLFGEGEGSTGGEASLGSAPSDPLQISLLHSVVTPRFWVLLSIRIISCWT